MTPAESVLLKAVSSEVWMDPDTLRVRFGGDCAWIALTPDEFAVVEALLDEANTARAEAVSANLDAAGSHDPDGCDSCSYFDPPAPAEPVVDQRPQWVRLTTAWARNLSGSIHEVSEWDEEGDPWVAYAEPIAGIGLGGGFLPASMWEPADPPVDKPEPEPEDEQLEVRTLGRRWIEDARTYDEKGGGFTSHFTLGALAAAPPVPEEAAEPTTLRVSWHPDAIQRAHDRLIVYRDWVLKGDRAKSPPPLIGSMDAMAAIDALRECGADNDAAAPDAGPEMVAVMLPAEKVERLQRSVMGMDPIINAACAAALQATT